MSLFRSTNISCPNCGETVNMEGAGSINADRRPDYRDDILQSNFQDETCPHCQTSFRLAPEFNYLDVGRGQWIAGMPANRLRDWIEVEESVKESFAISYGAKAPQAARDIGVDLVVRLTFGWPALREKIFANDLRIDDAVLEMLKLETIRRVPSAPLAEGIELRLVDATDETLTLVWIDAATEEVQETLQVRRTLLEAIVANEEGWKPIRDQLTDGPFVDIQKLFMGQGRTPAEATTTVAPPA
ncbi:MAG TPA: CpXC domain-containing protein [Chthoniobacter sp.]|nr:CpXC domain-containing protein [Chthoniobacter sp.]